MKKQLLKNSMMIVAFFATITMFAQPGPTSYDFAGGAQNWVKGFGPGNVTHNPTGGEASDGALVVSREDGMGATNNNTNIRRGQGGDDAFIVFDADVIQAIQLKVLNGTMATNFRVAGTSRPAGSSGVGANFGAINVNNVMDAESLDYQTIILDVSAITGEVTRLDILFRSFPVTPDAAGTVINIDSIEFLTTVPNPFPDSEYIKNPDFEDPVQQIGHMSGNGGGTFARALVTTDSQNGGTNLQMTFSGTPAAETAIYTFSNFAQMHSPALDAATTQFTSTMWVKSAKDINIVVRLKINNDGAMGIGGNEELLDDVQAVTGNSTWQQLTFTHTPTMDVEQLNFWFGVETNGDAGDPVNGDVVFFDNMTGAIGTLSVKGNTLDGVSVYPNPASDQLTLKTPTGGDIAIYNILGAQVKTDKTVLKDYSMNVSDLKSGIYLLRVSSEGKQFTQKLVIK